MNSNFKSSNYYTPPALRNVLSSKNDIKACLKSNCNTENVFHNHRDKVVIKRQVNDKWRYGKGRIKLILLCDKIIKRESGDITEEEIACIKKYIQKGCVISDPKDIIIHNGDSISILEHVLKNNKIKLSRALLVNWNVGNLSGKKVKEVVELVEKLKGEYKDNERVLKLLNTYF